MRGRESITAVAKQFPCHSLQPNILQTTIFSCWKVGGLVLRDTCSETINLNKQMAIYSIIH